MALTEGQSPILRVDGTRLIVTGKLACLVESKSRPDQFHAVSLEDGTYACTCESGTVRKSCRHISLVRRWLDGLAKVEFEDELPTPA
jgi:hypothetical protein